MEQLKSEQIRVQAEERRKTLSEETRQHQAVRAAGRHGPTCSQGLLLTLRIWGGLAQPLRPTDYSVLSVRPRVLGDSARGARGFLETLGPHVGCGLPTSFSSCAVVTLLSSSPEGPVPGQAGPAALRRPAEAAGESVLLLAGGRGPSCGLRAVPGPGGAVAGLRTGTPMPRAPAALCSAGGRGRLRCS